MAPFVHDAFHVEEEWYLNLYHDTSNELFYHTATTLYNDDEVYSTKQIVNN